MFSTFNCYAAGEECEEPLTPLPTFMVADFETEDWARAWQRAVGGQPDDYCGPVASRRALHFQGVRREDQGLGKVKGKEHRQGASTGGKW